MKKSEVITIAVLGTAVFIGVGVLSYKAETGPDGRLARKGKEKAAKLEISKLRQSLARTIRGSPNPSGLRAAAPGTRLTGKVVLVDAGTRTLDDTHMFLDGTLRAERPDEIRAVVWLRWDSRATIAYKSGDKGFVQTCSATVVDVEDETILAKWQFDGPPPTASKKLGSGDQYGAKPIGAVLSNLRALSAPAKDGDPSPKG